MRAAVYVWGVEASEQYFVGRVRRSLASASPDFASVEFVSFAKLGAKLLDEAAPVWLLRAGAWATGASRVRLPPSSATGRPLLARGAEGDPYSVYLEPPLIRALGERLLAGSLFEEALAAIEKDCSPRTVCFPPLQAQWDSRLRVLQVVTSLQRGGAERVALDLATQLPRCGAACRIATIGGPTRETFAIEADHLDLSRYRGDRQARAAALQAAAVEFGADVIHAHLLDTEDAQLLAKGGPPLVMTIHNQRPGWPAGLERLPKRCASLLAACSLTVEQELAETQAAATPGSKTPIRTVWNGVDFDAAQVTKTAREKAAKLRRSLGFGRDDFVLLSLANPRPQKRLDRPPQVLAATRDAFAQVGIAREVRLVFCGEHQQGNPAALQAVAQTNAAIERLHLGQHVRWLGSVADVATVLAASDVLVSTSAFEGLSLAQVEALAAGLPIVITDVGGARDIGAGNPAVTVVPIDAPPAQYAEALLAIARKKPIGGTAAARRHFTHALMAERYWWLYPRAIAAHDRKQAGEGIWLVTNNFSTGGAQSSAKRLLMELRSQGVAVRACVLQEQPEYPTPGSQELEAAGIRVLALPPPETIDVYSAVAAMLAEIDADPPAAVLCWNALAPYKLLLAEGLLDIPLFDVSPGEMYYSSLHRYFQQPLAALPYRSPRDYGRRLAGMIVKYQGEAEQARTALGCPVHVVPNGVDLARFQPRAALPISSNAADYRP